jgi:hypothetical protein
MPISCATGESSMGCSGSAFCWPDSTSAMSWQWKK